MKRKKSYLFCTLLLAALNAQEFTAVAVPGGVRLRHGDLQVLIHKNYPLVTIDAAVPFTLVAMKNAVNQKLELIDDTADKKSVRWLSEAAENRENEKVQMEFTVEVYRDFPGIFFRSKVFNRDFIGAAHCRQVWGFPMTEPAMRTDDGELRLGTAWRKLPPGQYFLYRSGKGQFYELVIPGLARPDRRMYSNFSADDWGNVKKITLFFGTSRGNFAENEYSEVKFAVIPVREPSEWNAVRKAPEQRGRLLTFLQD